MHNSRKGFTLAEVLVTLAIIGVVAALTIPTLISSTNASKFTTAIKKNLSTLNSALQTNIANNNMDAGDSSIDSAAELAAWFITGSAAGTTPANLNVLKWTSGTTEAWLADGTRLHFVIGASVDGCGTIANPGAFNPNAANACYVVVDTNGDKLPNTLAIDDDQQASDVWVLGISNNQVVPVTLTATTTDTLATLNGSDGSSTPYATSGVSTIPAGNGASMVVMSGST